MREKKELKRLLAEFIPHNASYCIDDLAKQIKKWAIERLAEKKTEADLVSNCDEFSVTCQQLLDEYNEAIDQSTKNIMEE